MRVRKWRGRIWAARLGLLALALNALVPVHLAFDLADAFEPAHLCGAYAEVGGAERSLLAMLGGHRDADGQSDKRHKHRMSRVRHAGRSGRLARTQSNGAGGSAPRLSLP